MNEKETTDNSQPDTRNNVTPRCVDLEDLMRYIRTKLETAHSYDSSAQALSLIATAAFEYAARTMQLTNFQTSYASLDFLQRVRYIEGPFMILKADDALYPQYNLRQMLSDAERGWRPWLREKAKEKLEKHPDAAAAVIAHWQALQSNDPTSPTPLEKEHGFPC